MSDLSNISGFPVTLDLESGRLSFGDSITVEGKGERTFSDLQDVLAFPDALAERALTPAYLLYRGVHQTDDAPLFASQGLRYDITVTLPGEIGGEYVKTAGHIHSNAPDGVGYPEIYDVLHGSAAFVLQWTDPLRLVTIECVAGDRIVIPPGASHLTVNHGSEPLVVADLVAIDSVNNYGDFKTRRGAAIYLTVDPAAPDSRRQIINRNYDETPTWRTVQGSRVGGLVDDSHSLYRHFIDRPNDFAFLTAPAEFNDEMQSLWIENRPEG